MSRGSGICRILVVEDDPLSRNALLLLLRHAGYTVAGARTVQDAQRQLNGQTHLITDMMLPGDPDVIALLEQTRAQPHPPHIAIVTSLERDHDLVRAAAQFEPQIILRKPVELDALLHWVEQTCT